MGGQPDMQGAMAAAMAQAMQVNGGAMAMAGLAMPAVDAKALEAGDQEAAAAAMHAAALAASMPIQAVQAGMEAAAGAPVEQQEQPGAEV